MDYLKYDNCHAKAEHWVVDRYVAMRDALNATGRPIFYSLCEWGVQEPWLWARDVGNAWRTTEVRAACARAGGGGRNAGRSGRPPPPSRRARQPSAGPPAAARSDSASAQLSSA